MKKFIACLTASLLALSSVPALCVGASSDVTAQLDRPALELVVGETDKLSVTLSDGSSISDAVWSTSDAGVVKAASDGTVTAVAAGVADVTVSVPSKSAQAVCRVYVVEERFDIFNDNIIISMFWPPIGGFITEEQYRWMAEAGINYVMGAGENVGYKDSQLQMLEYCYKYGMRMTVGDDRMGPQLNDMSYDDTAKLLAEYKNVPGVGGYWLIDEPGSPNDYINAYKNLKSLDPDKYVYLNFLPGVGDDYRAAVDDWLKLCAGSGYKQDYYIYDFYPFRLNSTEEDTMIYCLTSGWLAGLENNVKTGTFIQSVGTQSLYRVPTEDEIRWQTNISLAFGYKYLSYFTWFQPESGENFNGSIIDRKGNKTPLYDAVKQVNSETLAVGKTLVGLDALQVYFNRGGSTTEKIPSDFFVQPTDKTKFAVSFLRNPDTGRNYIMLVNNSYQSSADITVRLDGRITSVKLISNTDGKAYDYPINDGLLTVNAEIGGGYLFELPEGVDFYTPEKSAAAGNLAVGAYVTSSASQGGNKYYIRNLNDAILYSASDAKGWRAENVSEASVSFDLSDIKEINRVDIYPSGGVRSYGREMPSDITIQVSSDGQSWTNVKEVKGYKQSEKTAPSYTFDTVKAKYIRLVMKPGESGCISIAEVEIYKDDGSIPSPTPISAQNAGLNENIATDAKLTATSAQDSYGWSLNNLTDGVRAYSDMNGSNGYCSATDKPVDVVLDFGAISTFDRIDIYTAGKPYEKRMAKDFSFDVSLDGENWRTVYSVADYQQPSGDKLTFSFDVANARYLRWHIEAPVTVEVCVAELEVYCDCEQDYSALIYAYEIALASAEQSEELKAALSHTLAMIETARATQEEIDAQVTALEKAAGAPEETTAPVTEAAETSAEAETDKPDEPTKNSKAGLWIAVSAAAVAIAAVVIIVIKTRRVKSVKSKNK